MSAEKSLNTLKDDEKEIKDIKETYNIKDKNIYSKFQDFKKGSAETMNFIADVCDFFEKTKNLMKWEDPRMTLYFFLVIAILFFFVTFLPLRFIIVLWLFYKLHRGRFYHKRRVNNNETVCRLEF